MSTPANASGEEEAAPPSKRRFRTPSLGQAAALVGVITGIVGLVFIFRPGWKPHTPPDIGKVEISGVRVRQPVTFMRYLQRLKLAPGTLSKEQLRRRGVLIEFHAQITGFRDRQLPLRWELNDATTNDAVAEDEAVTIVPSTNDEGRKWFVWVPPPNTRRTYYVTVTIYQPPKGNVDVALEDFDSPEFRGLAAG